jgi:hypothetical protein
VVTLASGQRNAQSVAVNAADAYWSIESETEGASVMKVPLGGGIPATVAAAQNYGAGNLSVDTNSVYWTTQDAVVKDAPGGGAPTTLASGQGGGALAVSATAVVWDADYGCGDGCYTAAILEVPIDGGAVTTLATEPTISGGVAVDAESVYWSAGDGTIKKVPLGGGIVTTLVSSAGGFGQVVLDSTSVYWTAYDGVRRAPIDGGAPVTLASGESGVSGLAVDGESVYWAAVDRNSLDRGRSTDDTCRIE